MALAVRADVRGLGVKLAHKFVTVESIPLLGDNFWKQLQVSNFFFPSAAVQALQRVSDACCGAPVIAYEVK
jgi:hypothetical protein